MKLYPTHEELAAHGTVIRVAWHTLIPRDYRSDCWLFVGPKNSEGYGYVGHDGRPLLAYKVALLVAGATPEELVQPLRPTCGWHGCLNPHHWGPADGWDLARRCDGHATNCWMARWRYAACTVPAFVHTPRSWIRCELNTAFRGGGDSGAGALGDGGERSFG